MVRGLRPPRHPSQAGVLTDPKQKMQKAGNRSDLAIFFFFSLFLPEIRCGLTAYISALASLGKRTHGSPRLPPPALPPPLAEGSAHDAAAGEEALVGTGRLPRPPPLSCVALLRELGWARLVLSASSKLLMSWSLTLGFADRLLNASRIM